MKVVPFLKELLKGLSRHKATQVAAATTYFSIFSLPVVLVSVIWLAGQVLGAQSAQEVLVRLIQPLVGEQALHQVQTMIHSARSSGTSGTLPVLLAVAGFIYGLVGAFMQLQSALNAAWDVKPNLKKAGTARFAAKRLLSVLVVMAVAFLMLVFFVASVIFSSFGRALGNVLPAGATRLVLWGGDWLVSVGVILVLLAALFKFLPDARVSWRDVWLGAGIASVLFNIGKYIVALVVTRLHPGGPFGTAGSMVVLMIWINVSMLILLLGAEIVRVSARRQGRAIRPGRGSVRAPAAGSAGR
jgi:membrane protein